MKALVLDAANEPLQLKEVADPTPGPGEAVVALEPPRSTTATCGFKKGSTPG